MNRQALLLTSAALVLGLIIVGRRSRGQIPTPGPPPGAPLPAPVPSPNPLGPPPVLDEPNRLDELLALHVASEPTAGKLYQVGPDDTPESIARAVLAGVGEFTERNVLDYIYCFTSSPTNLQRYGTKSTSKRFPKRWTIPGFGQGLRAAFLPRNADAIAFMREGLLPPRTVHVRTAKALHGEHVAFGLLWLPPVDPEQLAEGNVTCAPFSWEDGSSTIDPDPELLTLLEVA